MWVHGDRAGPAARRVGRRAQLGLVRPFPREWGTNGEGPGVVCLACPLPVHMGRRTCVQHPSARANGDEPGVAYPHVPPSRAYGRHTRMHPSAQMGKAGGSVPSRTPFPGGVPACNSLPRKWGRVGPGVACPRIPRAYVAAWPREKGGPGGSRRGKGKGAWATWRGRAVCPRAPPFRMNGEGRGQGVACPRVSPSCTPVNAEGWARGSFALTCPLFARTGRRGQGEEEGLEGMGRGGGGPCAHPFRANGEGRGWGWRAYACLLTARRERAAACPCAHSFRENVNGGKERGRGQRCPVLGMGGGESWGGVPDPVAEAKRIVWASTLARLPHSHRKGDARGQADAPFPRIARREGRTRIRGTQCPPPLGLLGPPFSPIHAATFARKGGARGYAAAAPRPPFPCSRHPIHVETGHMRAPCGRATLYARKGHTTPWPLLFPFTRKGARGHFAPPLRVGPAPPRSPVRADRGRARALRPTTPSWRCPFPLVRTAPFAQMRVCEGKTCGKGTREGTRPPRPLPSPFAQKGGARGHTAPPLRVARTPFPFPPRHPPGPPFSLGRVAMYARGMQGHATPGPTLPHLRGRELHVGTPPGKGVRKGTLPPAFPIRTEGCTRVRRPYAREG
ncbi:hypothetical protein EDB89DRAFT_1912721, partial [Lactarius sanguifluus]